MASYPYPKARLSRTTGGYLAAMLCNVCRLISHSPLSVLTEADSSEMVTNHFIVRT
ncbi:MAG: hypothetical protein ACI868_001702, partial [Granulosicoccus sp.]